MIILVGLLICEAALIFSLVGVFLISDFNFFAICQVQSGDSIIVRGQPKGGPPPEKQINLGKCSALEALLPPTGNRTLSKVSSSLNLGQF